LVFSPAQAAVPVNGNYSCATGTRDGGSGTGYYTITSGVVSAGTTCTGAVVIASGVTSIGLNAFQNAKLTSINIPSGVVSIANEAFRGAFSEQALFQDGGGASERTSITIPARLNSCAGEHISPALVVIGNP
jgi:hypothetical protein